MKDRAPRDRHPSTRLGKGAHQGTDHAHRSYTMPGAEAHPASVRQHVSPGWSPKRVRPVHLSVCCTTCRAEVSKPWQVCVSPQSIATAGGSTSRAGRNTTNGALRLLLVGVSLMKQSRTEQINSSYPASVGIQTFLKILSSGVEYRSEGNILKRS